MARHRLRHRGAHQHEAFPRLAEGLLQGGERLVDEPVKRPPAVFIAHGIDQQWRLLRQFLEQDCGISVHASERGQEAGDEVASVATAWIAAASPSAS